MKTPSVVDDALVDVVAARGVVFLLNRFFNLSLALALASDEGLNKDFCDDELDSVVASRSKLFLMLDNLVLLDPLDRSRRLL